MAILSSTSDRERILRESRRVVVLGASNRPHRAGFYVPQYLAEQGYEVQGVNPEHAGEELFGQPVLARLEEVEGEVDLLDVFRRPDALPDHTAEILALRPKVVWFQAGIVHDAVAAELSANGIDVVQDRCTLADHRRFGLTRR